MVEGEGLDGEGGGPLVQAVPDHRRLSVRGAGEAPWRRGEEQVTFLFHKCLKFKYLGLSK